MASKFKLGRAVLYANGDVAQIPFMSGSRINATTSGAASTSEAALPAGARVIVVRATDAVWLRFGATGVSAADASANSILFPAGESIMVVPFSSGDTFSTHFRIMRVGANDLTVQIEALEMAGT